MAKCVKGFTMQEVKRTYEPGPDNERRLKSEIVTRKTVAPNLDAILFTLANLAPERWQIKTTATKRATSSIKSNCTTGIENNTIDNNPFHQNGPNQNEERPIDLSTLSDAALEELSRLPEWPNTERRDENEHQEDNKPIVSTTLSSPCKGNAETTNLSKDHNLSKPVFGESTDNRLATESPTDPRENKLSCHRVSSNSYPQEELTNNVTDPNYNDHTAQNCNINPIYGPFKPSTYRHKNSFEKKHFISSFSHRDLTFTSPSKNCTISTSQQDIGKPHKPNLSPHLLLFHYNATAIKPRSQTHHELEKSHTKTNNTQPSPNSPSSITTSTSPAKTTVNPTTQSQQLSPLTIPQKPPITITRSSILREQARRNFTSFAQYCLPEFCPTPFHLTYYRALEAFAKGVIKRLIVSVPPQHGKSLGSSILLPAFVLGIRPYTHIAIASYSFRLATRFNRRIQQLIDSDPYHTLFPETQLKAPKGGRNEMSPPHNSTSKTSINNNPIRTAEAFELALSAGSLLAVGREGSLTGNSVDLLILDDLFKDAMEANSPIIRDNTWEWYNAVARTRLHNNSQELLVGTRWHEEDLVGRLAAHEK